MPLVSIVTPVYNGARFLGDLLESVAAQTYPHIEHIVIDDGSTDGGATCAMLARLPKTRWWTRENRGQYATLNEGFAAATGEIMTTISADDFYVSRHAVQDVVDYFQAHADCDLVLGATRHVDESGRALPAQPFQKFGFWMMPYNPFVSHCSLFFRASAVTGDLRRFDESLKFLGDADWTVRMYAAGCRYRRIRSEIAAYRYHAAQATTIATGQHPSVARRAAEWQRFDATYVKHPSLKRAIGAYVSLQRRRINALAALRRGGVSELKRTVAEWYARPVNVQGSGSCK